MKGRFKKWLSLLVAVVLLGNSIVWMSGCSGKEVKEVEKAIDELEDLTPGNGISVNDYSKKVAEVQAMYDALPEESRRKVENTDALNESVVKSDRETVRCIYFDNLVSKCDEASDTVYSAWYYGIFDAEDDMEYYDNSDLGLAAYCLGIACGVSSDAVEQACEELDYSVYTLQSNWAACVLAVIKAMEIDGTFERIESSLAEMRETAKGIIREETSAQLEKVFVAFEDYINFIKSPDGSLSTYSDNVNDLKDKIEENRSALDAMLS